MLGVIGLPLYGEFVRKQASVAPWTPPWAGGEDNKKRGRTAPFFQVRIDRIQLNLLFDFLHAGDAHFDATIRRQAGDQLVLALDAVTLGAGDRIGFAMAFDGDLADTGC